MNGGHACETVAAVPGVRSEFESERGLLEAWAACVEDGRPCGVVLCLSHGVQVKGPRSWRIEAV